MPGRKWQNLIHRKCPDCDTKMIFVSRGFQCPDDKCHFFISKQKMVEILTNPEHAALRFASPHEAEILNGALDDIGVIHNDFWQATATDEKM
jgi:hypothetical protein